MSDSSAFILHPAGRSLHAEYVILLFVTQLTSLQPRLQGSKACFSPKATSTST